MKISQEEIKNIALLSRLEVKEDHTAHIEKELSDILSYVAELNALELDGVDPMAHAVPLQNVLREDELKPSLDHDLALSNAPEAEDGYFKVPRVVQE
ncbi:Asp-tRNA(Asn)/Glu-tRNA(Gln) amidotransferase subunit GatC [Veillonella sp. AS16]|uniref:Asp-tRNA(Asn)/Glu-tRNA(Gln) amidotransferase subunit GatC n=1 Tax=Veillonella sp. AS16 TaxID=936589 RepID=UPI0003E26472|nr:Asp-tRNA(Asn)/Glu-tRNA(Gln) amidotransferase subunit GatC [Veillonella sp. AS16]ETS93727.1 aspartyl/glutamyl-tRNA(Asn/Gln) amidotransferase, C subunit [Veillonella sp. AS16]